MQQLGVRRLTPSEAFEASQDYYDGIPDWVSIKWLTQKLNVSDRTIATYRRLLFLNVAEYQQIAVIKGVNLDTQLDNSPLTRRQAQLILHVGKLFAAWRKTEAVLSVLRSQYPHPLDE